MATLLICTQEMPSLTLDQDSYHLKLCYFPQSLQANIRMRPQNKAIITSFNILLDALVTTIQPHDIIQPNFQKSVSPQALFCKYSNTILLQLQKYFHKAPYLSYPKVDLDILYLQCKNWQPFCYYGQRQPNATFSRAAESYTKLDVFNNAANICWKMCNSSYFCT